MSAMPFPPDNRTAELEAEIEFLRRLCRIAERDSLGTVTALKRSLSWRLTAPLRLAVMEAALFANITKR